MTVTRDQARRLLSESEMTLFSDSRNPALRALSAAELTRRVERTRKLRDKSRDLLQRQRLGSRNRTGTKTGASGADNERTQRKGEVLEDILQRFESRLQDLQRAEGQAAGTRTAASARKPAAKTAAAKKKPVAAKKAPKRATPAPESRARTSAGSKAAAADASRARKATAGPAGTARAPTRATRPRKSAITPEQALAHTRELLEAKQQRDRQPPAYRMLDTHAEPGQPEPGYQSGTAKDRAHDLHAAEVRLEPIHGSVSTRGRQSQGKRDHR